MDFSKAVVTESGVVIIDNGDEYISIPPDLANSDYQCYLRWVENPNEVEHLTEIFPN